MDIRSMIRSCLSETASAPLLARLGDDDSLLENEVIDSLKMQKLIAYLEKTFRIAVSEDELMPDNFDSVNAIVAYVESKTGKK